MGNDTEGISSNCNNALMDDDLYSRLNVRKLSENQLRCLNFPRLWQSNSSKAKLYNLSDSFCTVIPAPGQRICRRCKSIYHTQNDGYPSSKSVCRYHNSKLSKKLRNTYYCCGGKPYSRPCKVAPQHVTQDIDPNKLEGFIVTQTNLLSQQSIYALDTEMVFTIAGMEVAAISIVDYNYQVVFETLVLPDAPIIDYNTESSELLEKHFEGVTTRLQDVHTKMLTLIGNKTILVGHGLENDLLRLKMIHEHIVDTIILYPHPRGLPFRNSLSFLKDKYLDKSIDAISGLKCRRDAIATMKLARLKCGKF